MVHKRFVSYDPDPYINDEAETYEGLVEELPQSVRRTETATSACVENDSELCRKVDMYIDAIVECSKINIRCAGITDNDPAKDSIPIKPEKGNNRLLYMIEQLENNSLNTRLFTNIKTLEYDLAFETENLSEMLKALLQKIDTDGDIKKETERLIAIDWGAVKTDTQEKMDKFLLDKAKAAKFLLDKIENNNFTTKGEFAQSLALKMSKGEIKLRVPVYIQNAFNWLIAPHIIKKKDDDRPEAK